LVVSALAQSLFYVEGRHRLAVEPLLLVLSGVGAWLAASAVLARTRRDRRAGLPGHR
jgi:hypothetical protein